MTLPDSSLTLNCDTALVAVLRDGVPGLRAAYRYGSFGTQYQREDSDLDLAVLANQPIDLETRLHVATELSRLTGKTIDLNDMRKLPVTLRVQIVTSGRRIFAADVPDAEEYDSRVLSDYARLNEERRGIIEDIRRRGSIYG